MAMTPQFELYAFWRSSATFRVRVALAMKGMLAHEHFVNMDAGEQLSPAYRAINPLAAIPTLVEPGHARFENYRTRHANDRPHHGAMRRAGCLCVCTTEPPGRSTSVNALARRDQSPKSLNDG